MPNDHICETEKVRYYFTIPILTLLLLQLIMQMTQLVRSIYSIIEVVGYLRFQQIGRAVALE